MVKLSGKNLPERQHELNKQVNEAASKNIPFDKIEADTETSEADKLFKIDLAAKYKNIDYLIEVFKNGDSFHISRVLKKCLWLFNDEFSNVINTDYLHHQLFPVMSLKMKKKLLTTASVHIKNEQRAADFYNYCSETNQHDLARKFLIFTSESFKLQILQNKFQEFPNRDKYLKHFLGNSFTLFEAYLLSYPFQDKNAIIHECSYLYNESDIKYLELLEKHIKLDRKLTLGLRISKDIVVKHKNRIIGNPDIYLHILNVGKLVKHSSQNEVEFYSAFLLPKSVPEFWKSKHQATFRQMIAVAPEKEQYAFAKKLFANVYHHQEFEMSKHFYDQKYLVSLMTPAEREAWALQHLTSGKEILGSGKDYVWYKYLNFEKAFVEIKTLIRTATNKSKRSDLLEVLIQSAKNNRELEQVLQYYYERHRNESVANTLLFMRKVIQHHNVLKFDNSCWAAFDKILLCVQSYSAVGDTEFKIVAILYNILNDKEMPEALKHYMEWSMAMYSTKIHIENEDAESKKKVYDYLFKFYLDRILNCERDNINEQGAICVHFLLELMEMFGKTKVDIPDKVMEYINHNTDKFKYKKILEQSSQGLSENDLIKCLKKDPSLITDKVQQVKKVISGGCNFYMKRFTNKLRVYFSDDIAKKIVNIFNDWLAGEDLDNRKSIPTAVFGLILLSDEDCNVKFMNKYAPTSEKMDMDEIDTPLMRIRESICRFACFSRPPVPLANLLMYLKGDYVKYCQPMFNRYLTNLPIPLRLKFVESLLDCPVSVQKQGLRLAFQCFSADDLNKLILNAWKNTKNTSIRKVIYEYLFEKAVNEQDKELCNILKILTLDLHDTDDDALFTLLSKNNKWPGDFIIDLAEASWATVKAFKNNDQNIQRKTRVIEFIEKNINLMRKETVKDIVSEHVKTIFCNDANSNDNAEKYKYLNSSKWKLVIHYIEYFTSTESDVLESVEIAKFIVNECLKRWNDVACDIYHFRRFFCEFIADLNEPRYVQNLIERHWIPDTKSYENALPVFEAILADLQECLPLNEIYIHVWTLRIIITARRVVIESRKKYPNDAEIKFDEIAAKFGIDVGNIIKDAVEKNQYFAYFSQDIKKIICNAASDIRIHLSGENIDIKQLDIELSITRGLLELNTKETHLMALQIVPLDKSKCNLDAYKLVYNTLKESQDLEIQCCMVKKFSGDCKRRRVE